MDNHLVMRMTRDERDTLVRAVRAMADEYRHVAEQLVSRYLAAGFQRDADTYDNLAHKLGGLADRATINETIRLELAQGNKINAIKFVRQSTLMTLKDAKDYVDNYDGTENYGIGRI